MNLLFLTTICFFFLSCNKNNDVQNDEELFANNKVDLTITNYAGDSTLIKYKGIKAPISIGTGYGLYINGKGLNSTAPSINVSAGLIWPSGPGSYNLTCEYLPTGESSGINVYTNSMSSNPGTITFTMLENNFAKGSFNTTCKLNTDSINIAGVFEGYLKHQ